MLVLIMSIVFPVLMVIAITYPYSHENRMAMIATTQVDMDFSVLSLASGASGQTSSVQAYSADPYRGGPGSRIAAGLVRKS